MLKVQKLYIGEYLKTLAVLGLGIASIFSLLELIDKIDEFLPYNPHMSVLVFYTLLNVPKFLRYLLPMAVLLSGLFVFSQALKRRELVVIKTATGRMKRILMPFVGIGVILTIFGFLLGEVVVPSATKKMQGLKGGIAKKDKKVLFREGTLYMRGRDGSVVRIGLYLPDRNLSRDVSVFHFREDGLQERIDAESASWEGDAWELRGVTVYDMRSGLSKNMERMIYTGIESPKIFQEDLWKADEMNIMELVAYQRRLSKAGFKNVKLIADISSRLSYPLINLFMLLLGISLTVGGEQRVLMALSHARIFSGGGQTHLGVISTGLGLLISLAYWFGYSLFLSLGYAGTIHPALAPWIVPFLFAMLSLYLYTQIPE